MDPIDDGKRAEVESTAVRGEVNPWLPPPPPLPPTQTEGGKPRGRVFIPATVLLLVLPVTTWDIRGEQIIDRSFTGERRYAIKPPDWLVELPDFVGLALVIALVTALGWLIFEYWLQSWGKWWFMALGSLCTIGVLAGLAGREATAADPVHDYPGFQWITVFACLCACVLLSILLITSLYKANVNFVALRIRKLKRFIKRHKKALLAISGVLVALGIASVVIEGIDSGNSIAEIVVVLTLGPIFLGLIYTTIGLIVLIPFVITSLVIWFVLFRSADLVLRRRVYW